MTTVSGKLYWSMHCVKSVQIRSYFWSVFSCIQTGYGDVLTGYGDTEIFSPNTGKYRPEITPYLDTFHTVMEILYLHDCQRISRAIPEYFRKNSKQSLWNENHSFKLIFRKNSLNASDILFHNYKTAFRMAVRSPADLTRMTSFFGNF